MRWQTWIITMFNITWSFGVLQNIENRCAAYSFIHSFIHLEQYKLMNNRLKQIYFKYKWFVQMSNFLLTLDSFNASLLNTII